MTLFFKKLKPAAVLPARATAGSAGYDLSACIESPVVIRPGETVRIPTGLAAYFDGGENVVLLVYPRSSLATKFNITLPNCVGVVDSDYRGEILVALINLSKTDYTVLPAARIAQLVVTPVLLPAVCEADELPETARGAGGFGSTGR
ncbi:MAG: dUTP diphosphatase [Oscillospiraceae bacterium]